MTKLYRKSSRWRKERIRFLQANPVCVMCPEHSKQPATVVDHIIPHKGDEVLFWDQGNWQPLCKPCHDIHKQRIEKGSEIPQKGLDGWPVSADANDGHQRVGGEAIPERGEALSPPRKHQKMCAVIFNPVSTATCVASGHAPNL